MSTIGTPFVVWRISDGKRGHDNQSLGLTEALEKCVPVETYTLPALSAWRAWAYGLAGSFPPARGLPDPDLLLGAGHATHLTLLAARRARGGRAVVLMKPSLPLSIFDLCVIPEHDALAPSERVLVTRGALNRIRPSDEKDTRRGLILLGGPSRHHDWSDESVLEQVCAIAECEHEIYWCIATSRRTPNSTLDRLCELTLDNVEVVAQQDTGAEWLPEKLARSSQVWVTEDSASMLYEALTANAATGVLPVPAKGESRIARGVAVLTRDGLVTRFADWQLGKVLALPAQPFNEAARAAAWISERWLKS